MRMFQKDRSNGEQLTKQLEDKQELVIIDLLLILLGMRYPMLLFYFFDPKIIVIFKYVTLIKNKR